MYGQRFSDISALDSFLRRTAWRQWRGLSRGNRRTLSGGRVRKRPTRRLADGLQAGSLPSTTGCLTKDTNQRTTSQAPLWQHLTGQALTWVRRKRQAIAIGSGITLSIQPVMSPQCIRVSRSIHQRYAKVTQEPGALKFEGEPLQSWPP